LVASNTPSSLIIRKRVPAEVLRSVYDTLEYDAKEFNLSNYPVFSIQIDELRTLNKFVALEMTPLDLKSDLPTTFELQVEVSVFHVRGMALESTIINKEKKTVTFECSLSQGSPCNAENIVHVPTFDETNIYAVVKILNAPEVTPLVDEFLIQSVSLDITYRIYLFAVKLILMLATIALFLWHAAKTRTLMKEFWTREQKAFLFIGPALITINEPFTIYLAEGNFYVWSTIVNFLVFSSLLMWYWLSTVKDLAGSDSSLIETSNKFAKYYAIVYFTVILATYITLGNLSLTNPTFDFCSTEHRTFEVLKIFLYVTLLGALAYIAVKAWRIFQRFADITEREQTYFLFSVFFLIFHFYLVSQGGLFIFSYDGSRVILFCGVSTLYVFATTYLYLPTKEGIATAQHIKKYDNPAVKDSYKDLEASGYHDPNKNNKNTIASGKTSEGEAGNEQKYPYEKKEEEEL